MKKLKWFFVSGSLLVSINVFAASSADFQKSLSAEIAKLADNVSDYKFDQGMKQLNKEKSSCWTDSCREEISVQMIAVQEKMIEKMRTILVLQNGKDITAEFYATPAQDYYGQSIKEVLLKLKRSSELSFRGQNLADVYDQEIGLNNRLLSLQTKALQKK